MNNLIQKLEIGAYSPPQGNRNQKKIVQNATFLKKDLLFQTDSAKILFAYMDSNS